MTFNDAAVFAKDRHRPCGNPSMSSETLELLLKRWQNGELNLAGLEDQLRSILATTSMTEDAQVDLDRQRRCGFPEVVFAPGKTPEAIRNIFRAQQRAGQNSLATRVTPEQFEFVQKDFPAAIYNPVPRTLVQINRDQPICGRVLVVSAGTSDRPVAEEALETARWMGCDTELILDVGVAGPQRLLEQRQRLQSANSIVVVAGMEGALPSVVAGWVATPVIAVPASVGYGANFGGFAALLSMLNSCAANVAVVNIDAGFKGGYLAALIARQTQQ